MPTYEYKCTVCSRITEKIYSMRGFPAATTCEACGNAAHKILSEATILRDEPVWLDDNLRNVIQDTECEQKIETRTQLNKHLKKRGIVENPQSVSRPQKFLNRKNGYMQSVKGST